MEIAPSLGLCRRIVDLVESGSTLKANGLVEIETILEVSSYLVINRTASKVHARQIEEWIKKVKHVIDY